MLVVKFSTKKHPIEIGCLNRQLGVVEVVGSNLAAPLYLKPSHREGLAVSRDHVNSAI